MLLSLHQRNRHSGTAVVELAVCLPILTVLIFGSIEACNLVFLKQSLIEAGYEGALLGSRPSATEGDIVQRVQTTLAAKSIVNSNIAVITHGPTFDNLQAGKRFSIRVDASIDGNVSGPSIFFGSSGVTAEVAAHKQ